MLRHLAENTALPVPAVHHADDRLLAMDFVATSGAVTPAVEEHAAELVAALHGIGAAAYGFPRRTVKRLAG